MKNVSVGKESLFEEMTDYGDDGMDLGSDASSRSCSDTSSSMVTPSSPSMHLVTLEDCEDDEDYQDYKRKVLEGWEGAGREPVNSRSLAEEFRDVPSPPPSLRGPLATTAAAVPEELKQNGNIIFVPNCQPLCAVPRAGEQAAGGTGTAGALGYPRCDRGSGCRTLAYEHLQVPPIDWTALEKHLAELPRAQEGGRGHNRNLRRTSSTSVSVLWRRVALAWG
ncbi:hypothetical protein MATL_G00242250 [Megalops atlanticus]|uniref:Schwannomin interacting protein 1 n=1 Tax=Megalops atlanticus TaxID=7932 RepID=A0A9D3PCG6_MEGAT|nr:hypothetical protein MATL_G00242250 [Megalops atlanticus]